jgi:hypothetical protein
MSITVVKKLTRPSTNVGFPSGMSGTQSTHVHENYVLTGKLIFKHIDTSSDGLTKTITRIFTSQADYDQYKSDPIVAAFASEEQSHLTNCNITKNINVV